MELASIDQAVTNGLRFLAPEGYRRLRPSLHLNSVPSDRDLGCALVLVAGYLRCCVSLYYD